MRATPDRDHAAPAQSSRAAASEPGPQGDDETTPGSPERARPTTPPTGHCWACGRPLGRFDPTPPCRSCSDAHIGPDDPYDPPEPLRNCARCGEAFAPTDRADHRQRFCSRRCALIVQRSPRPFHARTAALAPTAAMETTQPPLPADRKEPS